LLINSSFPGKAKKVGGDSFASCYPVLAYHPPFAYKINKNISKIRQTYLFFFSILLEKYKVISNNISVNNFIYR
jgi:hypothetical protein